MPSSTVRRWPIGEQLAGDEQATFKSFGSRARLREGLRDEQRS
jgi:hypothetical protein